MKTSDNTRRTFRRRPIQLQVRIRFKPPASFTKSGETDRLTLIGRTRNMSESGMAVLVSARNIDRYLTRTENDFDVELLLPEGEVAVQAAPVYFKKSTVGNVATYLIGCRFLSVKDAQKSRLLSFLQSLPAQKA